MNYNYNNKGNEGGNTKVLYRKGDFFFTFQKRHRYLAENKCYFTNLIYKTLLNLYMLNESAALVTLMRSCLQLLFGLEDHRFRWSYVHLCIIPLVLECNHFGALSLFAIMRFVLFSLYIRKSQ